MSLHTGGSNRSYIINSPAHEQLGAEPSKPITFYCLCMNYLSLIQYTIGICITTGTVVLTLRALTVGVTSTGWPFYITLLTFAVAVILIAYLEGLHVTIITLMHVPSDSIPSRAAEAHKLATQNLERFLVGRQFLISSSVFVCSLITKVADDSGTCNWASSWISYDICDFVISTGLGGSLIILAFGQILPQLLAASHPVYHYSLPGMYPLIWLCNCVSGICELSFGFADMFSVNEDTYGCRGNVNVIAFDSDTEITQVKPRGPTQSHIAAKLIRYIISTALVVTTAYYCGLSIEAGDSEFDISTWALALVVLALFLAMFWLEGMMTTILALEKTPLPEGISGCSKYTDEIIRDGNVVRKFLLGRQFLVVFTDFAISRALGMYGLPLNVIFFQASPQLIAARNPSGFRRLGFPVLYLALIAEFTGVTHAGWFLGWVALVLGERFGLLQQEALGVGEKVRWIHADDTGGEEPTPGYGLSGV